MANEAKNPEGTMSVLKHLDDTFIVHKLSKHTQHRRAFMETIDAR